jgi:hypothetical protein
VDELTAIWKWFNDNRWPMFVAFLLIGLAMCFFGNAFFQPVLFLTGVVEASFLIMTICYSTFAKHSP